MPHEESSPFRVTVGFLKNVVFAAQIHDAVLQVEFPFVPAPCDLQRRETYVTHLAHYHSILSLNVSTPTYLVVLANNHVVRIEQVRRIVIGHIVFRVQRFLKVQNIIHFAFVIKLPKHVRHNCLDSKLWRILSSPDHAFTNLKNQCTV